MKKTAGSLVMLGFATGLWGVSCSELSASVLKEEGQETVIRKDAGVAFSEVAEPLAHAALSSPIEQTLENVSLQMAPRNHQKKQLLFSFEEFKERCPGHYYERVSIGDGLYLCGLNTCKQYEFFLNFENQEHKRNNPRISLGEEFVESVIESAESPEETQFEVVQVLYKRDKEKSVVMGAVLLGRRADDPETILVEKFITLNSLRLKRGFILENFLRAFPHKIPALSSYLFSFRFDSLAAQDWMDEVNLWLKNGFRVDEVYLSEDSKKTIRVEPLTYFQEFKVKYKLLPPVSFTFFKGPSA